MAADIQSDGIVSNAENTIPLLLGHGILTFSRHQSMQPERSRRQMPYSDL
jgi:hypothetical protein